MTEWLNENVIWLIPAAPLAACVWIVAIGLWFRREQTHRPLVAALTVSFLASLYLAGVVVPQTFTGEPTHATADSAPESAEQAAAAIRAGGRATRHQAVVFDGGTWLSAGTFHVPLILRADAMSALMLVMVTSVSLLVAIFSSGYMHGDPGYPRFFAAMSLFVFSMVMLVLAGNFVLLFVFWEGVGLCSYLLIGYWFQRPSAAAAAKKAFVVNRIGDFGLLIGLFLLWTTFGSLDMATLLEHPETIAAVAASHPSTITAICLLLLVGAIGKSAQFPLHVWLPDAMEGPTPVSALIHAATMVTAGVYLIARCTPLFVEAPIAQVTATLIGAATALIAAITALTQYDLKRVLAYSTVSQLGYMFMAVGAGAADPEHLAVHGVTFAMFHMFTHAYFKGVLFLAAGSVMHAMGDVIDMRRFGGLRKALPITHVTFLCGALALAGAPLLSGFWSKDEVVSVLHAASQADSPYATAYLIAWIVSLLVALLTAFYTFRAYFLTFHGPERFPEEAGHHPHDASPVMAWPLYLLAAGAVLVGVALGPTHVYAGYLHHTPGWPHVSEHGLNVVMMVVSSVIAVVGIGAAYMLYGQGQPSTVESTPASPLVAFSRNGLYFDQLWTALVVLPLRGLARVCDVLDRQFIDKVFDAAALIPGLAGAVLRPFQNGLVQSYAFVMLVGLAACLLWMVQSFAG